MVDDFKSDIIRYLDVLDFVSKETYWKFYSYLRSNQTSFLDLAFIDDTIGTRRIPLHRVEWQGYLRVESGDVFYRHEICG